MTFARLVDTSRRVAETPGRRAKIALLAELLRTLPAEELEIGVAYLSGTLLQAKLSVGWATIQAALPGAAAGVTGRPLDGRQAECPFERRHLELEGARALSRPEHSLGSKPVLRKTLQRRGLHGVVRRRTLRRTSGGGMLNLHQRPGAQSAPCQTPTAERASAKASAARSRSSRVCAALIWVRMRASPRGTTGKEKLTA